MTAARPKSRIAIAAGMALLMCSSSLCAAPAFAASATSESEASEAAVVSASDNNSFTFTFKSKDDTSLGGVVKKKTNKSSVYVNTTKITCDRCYVYTDGAREKNGSFSNQTIYGQALIRKTGEGRIMNTVKENGYTYVRLTAWGFYKAGKVKGTWDPNRVDNSLTTLNVK